MKKLIILIGILFTLHGCIFVAGAAAGAAAIAVVYDHRSIDSILQDNKIAAKIAAKIRLLPALRDESHIEVTVFNRIVLLTGQTPTPKWKELTGQIAQSIPDVARVYNQIEVKGPTSALTRTSDSWITTKVKSKMLASDDLKTNTSSIKVVTEDGIVYLIGNVKKDQADIAVDIARQVSGVQKVVKVFTIRNF